MADANMTDYMKRVKRIDKKHRKMASGYVASVNHDGLIVAHAKRQSFLPRFPWKGVALCFLAFFAFKGFLLVYLGESTFSERVASLENGTIVEQAGAYGMSADPVTKWIAAQIQSVLR